MPGDRPSLSPLARVRAQLATPRGHRRVDALLSDPDAPAAVAALGVTDLFHLVHQIGMADAYELVALATPEQIRGCLDLQLWDGDRMVGEGSKPWLAAIIDSGYENLGRVWSGLDSELRALLLARWTRIYNLSAGEDPDYDADDDDHPMFTTPDTFFTVRVISDDQDTFALVYRLVGDLYRADMELARHTLMCAASEPTAELEEMSYRWRAGRLADLGYGDLYESLEVFRPIDPDSVYIGEGTEDRLRPDDDLAHGCELPIPLAETLVSRSFLSRALDGLSGTDEPARAEMALLVLVNKVLSAARVSPGDPEAVIVGAEHAMATVSLGLETVAKGNLAAATEGLRTISLTRLHQVGHTVTLRLARFARVIAPRARTAGEPTQSILAALLGFRPWFARELDDPAHSGRRPFESVDDIRRVASELTRLALRIAIADALGVDLAALAEQPEPRPELDDHVRTALIRVMAEGELSPAPLGDEELRRFLDSALDGGAITQAAREVAHTSLRALILRAALDPTCEPLLADLAGRWLGDIVQTLGGLTPGAAVDLRFVTGLVLAHRAN